MDLFSTRFTFIFSAGMKNLDVVKAKNCANLFLLILDKNSSCKSRTTWICIRKLGKHKIPNSVRNNFGVQAGIKLNGDILMSFLGSDGGNTDEIVSQRSKRRQNVFFDSTPAAPPRHPPKKQIIRFYTSSNPISMLMKYFFAQIFPAFPLSRSSVVNLKFNRNFTMFKGVGAGSKQWLPKRGS